MKLYNRLSEVLKNKEWTQKDLADKLNVSPQSIQRICTNRSQMSMQRLYEVAEILDIDVSELLIPTKQRVETITFTNGTQNYDPQRTHERLVKLLNQFYGMERFKVVPGILGIGDYEKIDTKQLSSGVGLLVNSNNLAGGDVGNVNLYKLVEVYLMDKEKRIAINQLL